MQLYVYESYKLIIGCGQACLGIPKVKTNWGKLDFVHAASYLLKLQNGHVVLDGHG